MFRYVPVAVQELYKCVHTLPCCCTKTVLIMFRHVPVAVQGRYLCVQTRPCCCTKTVLICSDTFLCTKTVLICSDTSLLLYKNCINMFRHVPVAVQELYKCVHTLPCCCTKTVLIMFRHVPVAVQERY